MLYSMFEKKMHELFPPQNGFKDDLYGLQFGSILKDFNISKIIVCLDLTKDVIRKAIAQKAKLIISHHGLTHRSIKYFNDSILKKIHLLSANEISLFVIHTAFDAATDGISEVYAKTAGLEIIGNLYFDDKGKKKPIGRIARPLMENTTIESIAKNLKRHLNLDHIAICGEPNNIVKKAAVVGGKGSNEDLIIEALKQGCDTYISGEFTHPEFLMARNLGLNLIASSHYKSENIGMQNMAKILSMEFARDEIIFIESEDPISFL